MDEKTAGVTIAPEAAECALTTFAPTVRIHGRPPDEHPLYALVGH